MLANGVLPVGTNLQPCLGDCSARVSRGHTTVYGWGIDRHLPWFPPARSAMAMRVENHSRHRPINLQPAQDRRIRRPANEQELRQSSENLKGTPGRIRFNSSRMALRHFAKIQAQVVQARLLLTQRFHRPAWLGVRSRDWQGNSPRARKLTPRQIDDARKLIDDGQRREDVEHY